MTLTVLCFKFQLEYVISLRPAEIDNFKNTEFLLATQSSYSLSRISPTGFVSVLNPSRGAPPSLCTSHGFHFHRLQIFTRQPFPLSESCRAIANREAKPGYSGKDREYRTCEFLIKGLPLIDQRLPCDLSNGIQKACLGNVVEPFSSNSNAGNSISISVAIVICCHLWIWRTASWLTRCGIEINRWFTRGLCASEYCVADWWYHQWSLVGIKSI